MKPLGEYFRSELTPEQKRSKGASDVAQMLRRMEAKAKKDLPKTADSLK